MPKQEGIILLKGTLYDKTYYKMNGQHLVRNKSSLNKKRVENDPAFANSRKSSSKFAQAAAIASLVYKQLPTIKRTHGLIGKLTGKANRLLHQGKTEADVLLALQTTFAN
jgi:hypothetical protein